MSERPTDDRRDDLGMVGLGLSFGSVLLYLLLRNRGLISWATPVLAVLALVIGLVVFWRALHRRGSLDVALGTIAGALIALALFISAELGCGILPGGT